MSITPGWTEKKCGERIPGTWPVFDKMIYADKDHYYIENGSEYKKYPRTKEGWRDLLVDLEDFEP